jgi:hypothetical protein
VNGRLVERASFSHFQSTAVSSSPPQPSFFLQEFAASLADAAPVAPPEDVVPASLPVSELALLVSARVLPPSEPAADEPPVLAAPYVPARLKVSHPPAQQVALQVDWQASRAAPHFGWVPLASQALVEPHALAGREHGSAVHLVPLVDQPAG